MDRFYNIPYGPRSRPSMYPKLPKDPNSFPGVYPGNIPITEYKKSKNGLGFLHNSVEQKDPDTPSRKVVVNGWRSWNMDLAGPHSGVDITSPVRGRAAVLKAEECSETAHCDPSCKPPCKDCECGVYLRYQPPSFEEEIHAPLLMAKGRISEYQEDSTKLQIWFFCEVLGKVIYGDIGARAEKVKPLFCIIPPIDDDTFRKLKIYLPAYFGPQLQLLRLEKEEIENLKWGAVWEE